MLIHVCFLSYGLFLEMTAIEKALFFLFCSRKKQIICCFMVTQNRLLSPQ